MAMVDDSILNEIRIWRNVFLSSNDSKRVLAEMLAELHLFDRVEGDGDIALQNYAKWLLFRLGIYTDNNIYEIVEKLSEISYNNGGE